MPQLEVELSIEVSGFLSGPDGSCPLNMKPPCLGAHFSAAISDTTADDDVRTYQRTQSGVLFCESRRSGPVRRRVREHRPILSICLDPRPVHPILDSSLQTEDGARDAWASEPGVNSRVRR